MERTREKLLAEEDDGDFTVDVNDGHTLARKKTPQRRKTAKSKKLLT